MAGWTLKQNTSASPERKMEEKFPWLLIHLKSVRRYLSVEGVKEDFLALQNIQFLPLKLQQDANRNQ